MEVKIYDKIEDKDPELKMPSFLQKLTKHLTWEDGLFCFVVIAAFAINFNMLTQLHQLPSPIYGGDYYNHLGSIEHIYQGGSVFTSGQMIGEIQWVPWLYHILVTIFAKVTTLSPMMAIIYFSLVALVIGCTIVYLFFSKFFDNKIFGLIAVFWHISFFPIFKYTIFAFYVVLPLFLFSAYLFLKKPSYKSAIFLGICYGLAGLSTTYVFIEGTFFLGFLLCYTVFFNNIILQENWKLNIKKKELVNSLILTSIAFGLGFAISLLWWYHPIFVYHAKTVNDMQIYGFPEVKGFGGMVKLVIDGFRNEFSIYAYTFKANVGIAIKRILMILGLGSLFLLRRKNKEQTFIKILLLASFFGLFIHFITLPLLGTLMASTGLFQVGMLYAAPLLALLALEVMLHYTSKIEKYKDYLYIGLVVVVSLACIIGYATQMKINQQDQWWKQGKTEMFTEMKQNRDWVLANTNLNDVFLTTNEEGFALNALTGRKIVTYRRTHASPYADLNQRMLDTALMLYGNNEDLRKALFEKYSVDYLYWHPRWIGNEFVIGQSGQIEGISDPLMIDYTAEREKTLKDEGINYQRRMWYMDPAWLPSYPQRDVLIILPARPDYEKPWHAELDSHLELKNEVNLGGQLASRIYKINLNAVIAPAQEAQLNSTNNTLE